MLDKQEVLPRVPLQLENTASGGRGKDEHEYQLTLEAIIIMCVDLPHEVSAEDLMRKKSQ